MKEVTEFKYLESLVSSDGTASRDIGERLAKAGEGGGGVCLGAEEYLLRPGRCRGK